MKDKDNSLLEKENEEETANIAQRRKNRGVILNDKVQRDRSVVTASG